MALILSYKLAPRALSFEASTYVSFNGSKDQKARYNVAYGQYRSKVGGFDPHTQTVTPLTFDDAFDTYYYLDSLTGAVEAGLVDDEKWPSQLFASKSDLENFLAELDTYDQQWRITDRWYQALGLLGGFDDQGEGYVSCSAMSDEIWRHAVEDLSAFSKPATPKAVPKKAATKKAPAKKKTKTA
ncbi:hypothetical protein [Hydrogenophaga sp.]|uniref:hypothetical protein n=1 Tax=Hydrogenophaga sp. TaxID=1904254 RepID=UPI003D2731B5